ncbi:phosphatase [Aeromonas phage BUCT695]|uniref:phosphatase n=1 Tax=Aeromonas phage BUCT695 TaxID=2908630 RepID=UPI0023296BC9|nr:phosphatase [Aeromonas phage BUCT695]UIW10541.1 putative phosphatase [Aeromonas phage BUCT695]
MIEYRTGDLVRALEEGEVGVIAHQANCFHTMKSGIAPQIVAKFYDAYLADCTTRKADEGKMGTFSKWDSGEKAVYNLYGQYHWSRNHKRYGTEYKALESALIAMANDLKDDNRPIGFPKIGCGLAGGKWELVEGLINRIFENKEVYVYVLGG